MASVTLLTYYDLISHLMNFTRGGGMDAEQSDYRDAVQHAFRDLVQGREWRYLFSEYRLALDAPYTTGTIAYDYTGGTYERMVTLTSGTWPTWAALGRITIAGITYDVEDRKSSTVITLSANNCPAADIAASTAYALYHNVYSLPIDFRSIYEPMSETSEGIMQYLEPDQWQHLELRDPSSAGSPIFWTIMGDPNFLGQMAIVVQPNASTAQGIRFLYQRELRPLRFTGYDAADYVGTVSGTVDGTTITGSGTAFADRHVGSVIRFTQSTETGFNGNPTGMSGLNPFTEQKIITARASATSITVDSPLEETYLAKKYTISDPLDLYPAMVNALLRGAEYQLSNLRNRDDVRLREVAYQKERLRAANADSMLQFSRTTNRCYDAYGLTRPLGADNSV